VKKKQDKIDGLFKDYFKAEGLADAKASIMPEMDFSLLGAAIRCCDSAPSFEPKRQCPDIATLGAFVDGSLDRNETGMVQGHISGCKKCRAKVAQAKSAIEQFEKGALPVAPQIISSEELSSFTKKNSRKK